MFILWRDTFTFYFIMYFLASPQRILVPGSGIEPVPLAVEGWNLNTGLPRKSLFSFYFKPYALNLQKLFTFDASFLFNNCVWLVPHLSFSIGIHSVYRYTLFHCALLILFFFFFLTNWMFVATQCQANLSVPIFPSSIYSLCICVSHFGDFHSIWNFSLLLYFSWWSLISHVTSMTHWRLRRWLAFLVIFN